MSQTETLPSISVSTLLAEDSGREWYEVDLSNRDMWGANALAVFTSQQRTDLRVLWLEEPDPEGFIGETVRSWVLESGDVFHHRYPTFQSLLDCPRAQRWIKDGYWKDWRHATPPEFSFFGWLKSFFN